MNYFEAYAMLFTDVLASNFAFNIGREIVFYSMKVFGNYNYFTMVIVASIAYFFAIFVNYILGKACFYALKPSSQQSTKNYNLSSQRIKYMQNNKFLPLLLILSAIPFFGKFILLFAGFCHIKLSKLILYAFSAKIIYYSMLGFNYELISIWS